jgi:hypothetical protein
MDTPTIYTLASTAWLSLQALPLLFTPKLIITLLAETDAHVATSTEIYFARLLAIAQLSIIVFSLLPSAASSGTASQQQQKPPYALTFAHVASFVYIYAHYTTLSVSVPSSLSHCRSTSLRLPFRSAFQRLCPANTTETERARSAPPLPTRQASSSAWPAMASSQAWASSRPSSRARQRM